MSMMLEWMATSSVLILIVLALRSLFRDKLSARLRYALWAVVLVRLLIPFQIPVLPAPVSLSQLTPRPPQAVEETRIPVLPQEQYSASNQRFDDCPEPGDYFSNSTGGQYRLSDDGQTVTRYLAVLSPAALLWFVWAMGLASMCLVFLASNLHFARRLKARRKKLALDGCPLPVYTVEGLPSPCLFGLCSPAVYLTPEAAEQEPLRRHVLAHELTHHAHRDHIWAPLRCLCLALHWYNPLVWLAVVLSKRDGELACDEGAVARLGEGERLRYGRTLVDMVAQRKGRPADLFSCSTAMTQGKKSIQQRVALLVKRPETVKTALFAALSILSLALVFTFAGAKETAAPTPGQFLKQVEQAQAVYVTPSAFSSQIYPDPITDQDLLAQVKTLLRGGDSPAPPQGGQGWDQAPWRSEDPVFTCSSFSLSNDPQGQPGQTYYLADWEGTCYVLAADGRGGYSPVSMLSGGASSNSLISLARQQYNRALSPVSDAGLAVLEETAYLRVSFGPASSFLAPEIVDFDLLAQAKDILRSGDPDSGTVSQFQLYDGSCVTFYGEDGSRLATLSLSNQEMCEHLFQLSWEQYRRDESRLSPALGMTFSVPTGRETGAANIFGYQLRDYLLNLPQEDQYAVTLADPFGFTLLGRTEDPRQELVEIAYRVEPRHPDAACWSSNSTLTYSEDPGPYDGPYWVYRSRYLLEQEEGETWRCTSAGLSLTAENALGSQAAVLPPDGSSAEAEPVPADSISAGIAVPAALLPVVERELSSKLDSFMLTYSEPQAAVHLTAFTKLLQYDRLLKAGTVCVYRYDYAFSDVDGNLNKLHGWSGVPGTNGPWVEENGLVHPTHLNQYLLTVERDGQVVQYTCFEDHVLMREGELDGAVDADYLLDMVVQKVRRMLRPTIPSGITDGQQAVEAYAQAMADYYLSLGPEHPNAVTSAQVAQVELLERDIYSVCARISLALDPVQPDTAYWMSKAGIDYQTEGQWAGHWLYTLDYLFDYDTGWYCSVSGTEGISIYQSYAKSFTALPEREVALTATLDRKARTLSMDGETGPLTDLFMSSRNIRFDTGSLSPTPTIEALTSAIDNGSQDLSQWLRVYADGQSVPGTAAYSRLGYRIYFTYTFDHPLPYDSGFVVTMELGARE